MVMPRNIAPSKQKSENADKDKLCRDRKVSDLFGAFMDRLDEHVPHRFYFLAQETQGTKKRTRTLFECQFT